MECGSKMEEGAVAGFFADKDVLVTGASGFLGRVLLEKLLREAPQVGTVFVMVRPKRGLSPQQRVARFTDVSLFERLRKEQPRALEKLRAVEGDTALPELGLSTSDRALLQERVAVVFHVAASVRFDDPLRKAVFINVRGTRDLCQLALGMPRLKAFVHVSTAYSNSNLLEIEEILYPSPGNWMAYIDAAETMDSFTLDVLTSKLLGDRPNTYIFTKAMAEHVINHYRKKLPIGIIRPSIVSSAEMEPFPGWIDNLNGAMSSFFSCLVGVCHTFLYDISTKLDAIPVDYVVGGIVLAALHLGICRKAEILPIFNATATNRYIYDIYELGEDQWHLEPDCKMPRVYKNYALYTTSELLFRLLFIFLDLPVSLTLDGIAWIAKKKRRMLKIHRRVVVGQLKVTYFTFHTFKFTNRNFLSLINHVGPRESKSYNLSTEVVHFQAVQSATLKEFKEYFFPKISRSPEKQHAILEIIHFSICGLLLLFLWKLEFLSYITKLLMNGLKVLLGISTIQLIPEYLPIFHGF